jgi:uncharacterized protein YdcH (DUF465 family)
MTHISQHIHDAFPGDAEVITRLKADDAHFQKLAAQFEAIDHDAAEAETGADPASDARTEALKKRRLALLDEIAVVISHAKTL